uniref:Target of myb1 like 2 membrane trafficking protein n=1 Tax=Scophthalmus maximus TaxID=52904 RepID=A0A8D3E181_SCOMX
MEFLLGNPYSTPVGHCIERATDGSLQSEDWTLNMEICDLINETEDGPKDAIRAVKKRLNGNRNYREVMFALTVLETCVKNCGHRFHALVTSRDFVDGVLVKIISPKNNPPTIVQDKVLGPDSGKITAWADAFRSSPDLTGVVQIYEELKRKGIEFPMSDLETLSPIHTPLPAASAPEGDSTLHKYSATPQPPPQAVPPAYTEAQVPHIHAAGSINPTPEQICQLRSELDVVRGNTKVMSEMLTEMVPGQEDASDYELLQELNRTCRAMQQRIVELISCVSSEAVTEELLHVNDDLNNIFLRYDRLENTDKSPHTNAGVNPSLGRQKKLTLIALHVCTELVRLTEDFLCGVTSEGRHPSPFPQFPEMFTTFPLIFSPSFHFYPFGPILPEFDKFLEERAKAAETVPSLPSPPSGDPGAAQGTPSRKKPDRPEDALFAM